MASNRLDEKVDGDFVVVNKYSMTNFADLGFGSVTEEGFIEVEESKEAPESTDGSTRAFMVKDEKTLEDLLNSLDKVTEADPNPEYSEIIRAISSADQIIYNPSLSNVHVILIKEKADALSNPAYVNPVGQDEAAPYPARLKNYFKKEKEILIRNIKAQVENASIQLGRIYQKAKDGVKRFFTIIVQGVVIVCEVLKNGAYLIKSVVKDGKIITASILHLIRHITKLQAFDALETFAEGTLNQVENALDLVIKALQIVQDAGNGFVRHQVLDALLTFENNAGSEEVKARNLLISNIYFFHTLNALAFDPTPEQKKEEDVDFAYVNLIEDEDWKKMLEVGHELHQKLNEEIADASHPLTNVGFYVGSDAKKQACQEKRAELCELSKLINDVANNLQELNDHHSQITPRSVNALHEKIVVLENHAKKGEPTLLKAIANNWAQIAKKVLIGLAIAAVITLVGVLTGGTAVLPVVAALSTTVLSGAAVGWGISDANRWDQEEKKKWSESVQAKATLFAAAAKKFVLDKHTPDQEALKKHMG